VTSSCRPRRRRSYWLSCAKFTIQVEMDQDNVIVFTAPIVKKFVGQEFDCLVEWMAKLGDFVCEVL